MDERQTMHLLGWVISSLVLATFLLTALALPHTL